ncbi:HNH endonuclease [Mesorhizobium sp. ASY16-5R]|uniref:HNH endonuclease n=1 Tax=Mesorhizobium sp. ASY16-5R TaxID=3445772 RepID=UPI003FA0D38D
MNFDKFRTQTEPWRKWYRIKRWRILRDAQFLNDRFTCRMCNTLETDTSRLVCDHVEPHKGDEVKFWAGPFQTLCASCHSGHKQSHEKRGYQKGVGFDGWPIDPGHPWNKSKQGGGRS